MNFEKRTLATAEMGYAVATMNIAGARRVIAASESTGPAVVFDGPTFTPRVLASAPGGTMGFAEVPRRDDALLAITRFYPIFKAEGAGIDLFVARNGLEEPWEGRRVIDLPFVHRMATVSTPVGDFLVAASVCGGKAFQEDWSRPGAVVAFRIPDDLAGVWEAEPILEGIHRNHGMAVVTFGGVRSLLIAGTEGVFALSLPGETSADGTLIPPWSTTKVLDHDVSEVALGDFDGDGAAELAVIEPFHGDRFAVYKEGAAGWSRVYEAELAFGHGLSVGSFGGTPVAVVGNRAGSKDLVCFRVTATAPLEMERIVVDPGTGTAGTAMTTTADGDGFVASNPEFAEYALYLARVDDVRMIGKIV
jgi:hypothetical protein